MNNDTPDDDRTVAQPPPNTGPRPPVVPPSLPVRSDSGNALPLGTYLDEFELRSFAGEGGFSIVYRAWDHSLKRQVAVKEYFPSGMVGRSGGTQVVVRSERHTDALPVLGPQGQVAQPGRLLRRRWRLLERPDLQLPR